jgi:hypothetical protein
MSYREVSNRSETASYSKSCTKALGKGFCYVSLVCVMVACTSRGICIGSPHAVSGFTLVGVVARVPYTHSST